MSKKYFIWKDRNCNGVNPEWIELSGSEFYQFINRPENKMRRFQILDNRIDKEADIIVLEVTESQFKKWKSERNHETYLDNFSKNYSTVSMSDSLTEEDDLTVEDIIPDLTADVEDKVIRKAEKQAVKQAFESLTNEEKQLIKKLYVKSKGKTESYIARANKIPQKTLNNRKLKIRKNLKKYLAKFEN